MELQSNHFSSEQARILWAIGFLEGEWAQNWARSYQSKIRALEHERYVTWDFYKAKL